MTDISRRLVLRMLAAGSAVVSWPRFLPWLKTYAPDTTATGIEDVNLTNVDWSQTHDRVWLSGDCWANPMEDWRVIDGAAECIKAGADRNVHLLTHQVTNPQGALSMSVEIDRLKFNDKPDLGAGFKIGIRSDINEFRSNCFEGNGTVAGVVGDRLVIGSTTESVDGLEAIEKVRLSLAGAPADTNYRLTLVVSDLDGNKLGEVTESVPADTVLGNVAIVSNYANQKGGKRKGGKRVKAKRIEAKRDDTKRDSTKRVDRKRNDGKRKVNGRQTGGRRFRFNHWQVSGSAFTVTPDNRFGPILWSMYTLSDSRSAGGEVDEGFVLKLSALTGPLGQQDNKDVELLVNKNDQWQSLGTAALDTDAWTATWRIPNWDQNLDTPYKLIYKMIQRDGSVVESSWEGNIQANPVGRPLRIGALTCQKDYGFPYAPVAENLRKLDPDMLYFSGDQLYEDHGGFGLVRAPADRAILNYLRKYYMHGWAFRDVMKNAPTVCLPDDHDVFQGNYWGESGAPMKDKNQGASSSGGYIEPARMVNVVHKTNCAHHPDYHDPTPVQQGISVYYGDMVYGDVSFAIISDRQFKSGPEHVDTGGGRADHVPDQDFDTSRLDLPDLVLLGQRQEEFLQQWVNDWRGHSMKVLLSQTVFAGVATHHGNFDGYLKGDLDSGAWPQTARDRAVKIIRQGKALHINGDQHLTTLVQYGVDQQRDSGWSFCTPAIAVGYPRWWHPDRVGMPHKNRPSHGLPNTGEYTDGFGNLAYVYAAGNPGVGTKKNRYELAHQKGSGFGMVTIDGQAKTYLLEAFRFLVDATDGKPSNQFSGWPVTIHQQENAGENLLEQ